MARRRRFIVEIQSDHELDVELNLSCAECKAHVPGVVTREQLGRTTVATQVCPCRDCEKTDGGKDGG